MHKQKISLSEMYILKSCFWSFDREIPSDKLKVVHKPLKKFIAFSQNLIYNDFVIYVKWSYCAHLNTFKD